MQKLATTFASRRSCYTGHALNDTRPSVGERLTTLEGQPLLRKKKARGGMMSTKAMEVWGELLTQGGKKTMTEEGAVTFRSWARGLQLGQAGTGRTGSPIASLFHPTWEPLGPGWGRRAWGQLLEGKFTLSTGCRAHHGT
jgi:hypothetical protein